MTEDQVRTDSGEQTEATDADIERLLEQGEAGIGDVLAAYDLVEQHYVKVVSVQPPTLTSSTNTARE